MTSRFRVAVSIVGWVLLASCERVEPPRQAPAPPRSATPRSSPAGGAAPAAPAAPALTLRVVAKEPVMHDAAPRPTPLGDPTSVWSGIPPLPAQPVDRGEPVLAPSKALVPAAQVAPLQLTLRSGSAVASPPAHRPGQAVRVLAPPEPSLRGVVPVDAEARLVFDEPMVAVGALAAAPPPPATFAPPVPGAWRWLDASTAVFLPTAGRFASATNYTLLLPAGLRSASGAVLDSPARFSFSTPSLQLLSALPSRLGRRTPIALLFDQRIDAAAVFSKVRVEHAGRQLPIRRASLEEARVAWRVGTPVQLPGTGELDLESYQVVIAPQAEWPAGTELRIIIGKGALGDGPRATDREELAEVEVVPPLHVRKVFCERPPQRSAKPVPCPPGALLRLDLSTPLAPDATPVAEIDGVATPLHADDRRLTVPLPGKEGRVTVRVVGEVQDVYGQRLAAHEVVVDLATKHAAPRLEGPQGVVMLDPRFSVPQWVVGVRGISKVKVQLWAVEPRDFFAFSDFDGDDPRARMPGRKVFEKVWSLGDLVAGKLHVDLRPALSASGTGHVIARALPLGPYDAAPISAWLQVTRLVSSVNYDRARAFVWVHRLGGNVAPAPVAATTTLLVRQGNAINATGVVATDASGRAEHRLLPASEPPDELLGESANEVLAVARVGDDSAFAVASGAVAYPQAESALWYVTDAQRLYRPGETLHVKGYLRWKRPSADPQLEVRPPGERIRYVLTDARDTPLVAGELRTRGAGSFDLSLAVPRHAELGHATLTLTTRGESTEHRVQLADVRPAPFLAQVELTRVPPASWSTSGARPQLLAGDVARVVASSQYWAGGGLGGALVRWRARLAATFYTPPGWESFGFSSARSHDDVVERVDAWLSANGRSVAEVGTGAVPWVGPSALEVEAEVRDVDRQVVRSAPVSLLVHGSEHYVGLREASATEVEAIVVDPNGVPKRDVTIHLTIEPESLGLVGRAVARSCVVRSQATPVRCSASGFAGQWRATARVVDPAGRVAVAEIGRGLSLQRDSLALSSSVDAWQPGKPARVVIHSDRFPATAILTVARAGILSQRRIALSAAETPIDVDVPASGASNLHVLVQRFALEPAALAAGGAVAVPLPAVEEAALELAIDDEQRQLDIELRAPSSLAPGQNLEISARVSAGGRPAKGAEIALFAVDEAVLAVADASHADPLGAFLYDEELQARSESSLQFLWDNAHDLLGNPGEVASGSYAEPSIEGLNHGRGLVPTVRIGSAARPRVRRDFRATAFWAPRLEVGADGVARAKVKLPDTLTRYRVVALASLGNAFGKAESALEVSRPIAARISAPRWLGVGDSASLTVVAQNLERESRQLEVGLRARGLEVVGPAAQRLTLAAGARAELRFDVAARAQGTALVQAVARAGAQVDVVESELPILAPTATERSATYLAVSDAAQTLPIAVPREIDPSVGGLEITLASSELAGLAEAYWYLQEYPYECAEQRSARVLANATLSGALELLQSPGRPNAAAQLARRNADLQALAGEQRSDGSWGLFSSMPGDVWVTLQVVRALGTEPKVRRGAKQRRDVPALAAAFDAGVDYVGERLHKATRLLGRAGADRERRVHADLAAAALDTLCEVGSVKCHDATGQDASRALAQAAAAGALSLEAKARLVRLWSSQPARSALRETLRAELIAATRATASSASVVIPAGQEPTSGMTSEGKTTALVLEALASAPAHPLAPKLARGLLERRSAGRWGSTHENLAVLRALQAVLAREVPPRFAARVAVGELGVAEHAFAGALARPVTVRVPWSALPAGQPLAVGLERRGQGTLSARVAATYAPRQRELPALDAGFVVHRSYASVDPADLVRKPDGSLRVRLGAELLVTVEVDTTATRYDVAVVDELPAGFASIDPSLAKGARPLVTGEPGPWEHINLRATRTEAFIRALPRGKARLAYAVRAVTPGTFRAGPAHAEEMYTPETFGRSTSAVIVIE